jgi:hypothetical protein
VSTKTGRRGDAKAAVGGMSPHCGGLEGEKRMITGYIHGNITDKAGETYVFDFSIRKVKKYVVRKSVAPSPAEERKLKEFLEIAKLKEFNESLETAEYELD